HGLRTRTDDRVGRTHADTGRGPDRRMTPFVLRRRRADLREIMDGPEADPRRLFRTYDGFRHINPVFSRWKQLYRRWILPEMRHSPGGLFTLLDIGCGGADLIEAMVGWA